MSAAEKVKEGERESSARGKLVVGELWRRKSVGCCTWTRKAGALTVNPDAKLQNLLPGVVLSRTTEPCLSKLTASLCETFTSEETVSGLFPIPLRWDSCFLSHTLSVAHPACLFAMEVLTDRVLEVVRGEAGQDI